MAEPSEKPLTREEVQHCIVTCDAKVAKPSREPEVCDWAAKAANWRRVLALLEERDRLEERVAELEKQLWRLHG